MGDAATLTREVTFQSKCHNLRLVRVQETEIPDPLGGKGQPVPGLRYEFADNRMVVDQAMLDRDDEFFRNRAQMLGRSYDGDPGTLEWLREHTAHGHDFAEIPLSDLAPPPDEAITQVVEMAADLNADGLEALLAEERETFQRPLVIGQAEQALERVKTIRAAESGAPAEVPPSPGSDPTE